MKKALIIGAVLALIVATILQVYASEESYQVEVTAEVELNCAVSTHMYTEECIKRFTDDIAQARALKAETRKQLDSALEDDNKADELLDKALENYNTVYGG